MQAFLNGAFVELESARVAAMDAGFQHAVGLFETMLGGVRDGQPWVIGLDQHTERLANSAAALDLSPDLRAGALADAVLATVARSGLARLRVKLTVTGGDLNLLARGGAGAGGGSKAVDPTVLITTQPATVYPEAMLRTGVAASLADARANNFNPTEGHKTLNYWWRLRELQGAGRKGAAEALVFDVTNHLAGGCVSNAFIVKGGVVLTPIAKGEEGYGPQGPTGEAEEKRPAAGSYLPSPVLLGVTRAWVIDQLSLKGTAVERRMLTIDDVLGADELFLTNSSWGVLPIVQLEAKPIGERKPGPVTAGLVGAWQAWVG